MGSKDGDKLVIAITGMPGAGKTLAAEYIRELIGGYIISMGDVIREIVRSSGGELTSSSLGNTMIEIREKEGASAVAKRCVSKIKELPFNITIIDGVRSFDEVEEFKRHFKNVKLIAVLCPPKIRFERLKKRGREDDPKSIDAFRERDMRELSIGLGNAIALADHIVVNDSTKKHLKRSLKNILTKIARGKWTKK